MLSRIRTLSLAAFAVCALSAIAVASASGAWFVGGTELKTGEEPELATLVTIHKTPVLAVPGVSVSISCTHEIHIIGRIHPPAEALIEIIFLGCHTISPTPTKCQLEAEGGGAGERTIQTTQISGKATLTKISGGPKSGKVFAEIPFVEGTACVFEGKIPVKGEATLAVPDNATEQASHKIEGLGSVENNSLEVGSGNKGFLTGVVLEELKSKSKWAFK